MNFHTLFSPPPSSAIKFTEPSTADQSQRKDCDINRIMERFQETGYLVDPMHPGTAQPMFGDFSEDFDYQKCLEIINNADEAFSKLPAHVRDRFANNPQNLMDFLNDENNFDEAVKLGLCNPRKPAEEPAEEPAEKPAEK